jgi:hypothetical protein
MDDCLSTIEKNARENDGCYPITGAALRYWLNYAKTNPNLRDERRDLLLELDPLFFEDLCDNPNYRNKPKPRKFPLVVGGTGSPSNGTRNEDIRRLQ